MPTLLSDIGIQLGKTVTCLLPYVLNSLLFPCGKRCFGQSVIDDVHVCWLNINHHLSFLPLEITLKTKDEVSKPKGKHGLSVVPFTMGIYISWIALHNVVK